MSRDERPTAFNINVPPEHLEGHYADFASVWHNSETFVLDFVSMSRPPVPSTDDDGTAVARVDAQVVTRGPAPGRPGLGGHEGPAAQLGQWEAAHPDRRLRVAAGGGRGGDRTPDHFVVSEALYR